MNVNCLQLCPNPIMRSSWKSALYVFVCSKSIRISWPCNRTTIRTSEDEKYSIQHTVVRAQHAWWVRWCSWCPRCSPACLVRCRMLPPAVPPAESNEYRLPVLAGVQDGRTPVTPMRRDAGDAEAADQPTYAPPNSRQKLGHHGTTDTHLQNTSSKSPLQESTYLYHILLQNVTTSHTYQVKTSSRKHRVRPHHGENSVRWKHRTVYHRTVKVSRGWTLHGRYYFALYHG